MDFKDFYLRLFDYEKWANTQIIEKILTLPEIPTRVQEIMAHILSAQEIWLSRLENKPSIVAVWEKYSPEEWEKVLFQNEHRLKIFIENLQITDFQKIVHYKNSKGDTFSTSILDILTQLSHHSAYHRGQIIVLIKPWTKDLPLTDFIFYSRK